MRVTIEPLAHDDPRFSDDGAFADAMEQMLDDRGALDFLGALVGAPLPRPLCTACAGEGVRVLAVRGQVPRRVCGLPGARWVARPGLRVRLEVRCTSCDGSGFA